MLAVLVLGGFTALALAGGSGETGGHRAQQTDSDRPPRLQPAAADPALVSPPPAEQPAGGPPTGQVRIVTELAGASIRVDGLHVGPAPALLTLTSGTHVIEVVVNGQSRYVREVVIETGKRVVLRVP